MPRNWDKYILVIAAALSSHTVVAAERMYYFVDEQGVTHLSNIPMDARYRPAGAPIASAAVSAAGDIAEQPVPELEAIPLPVEITTAPASSQRVLQSQPPEER